MDRFKHLDVNAPDFISICIDEVDGNMVRGRFYHKIAENPVDFCDVNQLLLLMDDVMEQMNFPQASTRLRSFGCEEKVTERKFPLDEIRDGNDILKERGKLATFHINVKFRQCSSWQGVLFLVEKNRSQWFSSDLSLLMVIDSALELKSVQFSDEA